MPIKSNIRTTSKLQCPVCGDGGVIEHASLEDHLFGAPGDWSLRRCSNKSCELLWLDPCPLEEDISKAYVSYYTHADVQNNASLKSRSIAVIRDFLVDLIIKLCGQKRERDDISHMYLSDVPPGRILDIGCGDARFLNRMKQFGWSTLGVDFDAAAASNAKKLFGIDVQIGKLEDMQFPDDTFDAVTMNHVIEHVYDPVVLLREVRRILKPGGRLVVVTPNALSMGHRVFGRFWRGLEPPRHIQIFTPLALGATSRKAELEISRLFTTAVNAWIIILASLAIKRQTKSNQGGVSKPSRAEQIQGLKLHLAEAFRLKKYEAEGEEIVLIAIKNDANL